MRLLAAVTGLLSLAACSSPADTSRLTLNNPYWERVNVQLVITRSSDCDNRAEYIDTR